MELKGGLALKDISDEVLGKKMKSSATRMFKLYERTEKWPKGVKELLMSKIKWKQLARLLKEVAKKSKGFIKLHGVSGGLAYLSGWIIDLAMISILRLTYPILAPFSVFVPSGVGTAYAWEWGRSVINRRRTHRLFGGKESYRTFKKTQKEIRAILKINRKGNFLHPVRQVPGVMDVAIVENPGTIQKIFKRLGFSSTGLDLDSLHDYLAKWNFEKQYVDNVMAGIGESKKMKTLKLLNRFFRDASATEIARLKLQFPKNFLKISVIKGMGRTRVWSMKMANAKTIDEIKNLLKKPPPDMNRRLLASLWDDLFIPKWSEDLNISHWDFHNLRRDFEAIKAKIVTSKISKPINWTDDFSGYLDNVLDKSAKRKKIIRALGPKNIGNCFLKLLNGVLNGTL